MKKRLIITTMCGIALIVLGWVFELLKTPGLSYGTGYWHLQWLDTYFYALGSERHVKESASFCNFCLGAMMGFGMAVFWRAFTRDRALARTAGANRSSSS